jgi:general secretion pathway protein G
MNRMTRKHPASQSHLRRAFTLIELLLVLVILAVLAAVVVPKFTGRTDDAKIKATKAELAILEGALDRFEIDNGRFPPTEGGLQDLVRAPSYANNWKGPYIKAVPQDKWGNAYIYRAPGQHNADSFDLYSMGPNGRDGDDDLTNWGDEQK